MVKGCRDLMMEHSDALIKLLMERASNEAAEHDVCYTGLGVCVEKSADTAPAASADDGVINEAEDELTSDV